MTDRAIHALITALLVLSLLLLSGTCSPVLTAGESADQATIGDCSGLCSVSTCLSYADIVSPTACDPCDGSGTTAPIPDNLSCATIIENAPDCSALTRYTQRCFNESTVAAIAWWMNPVYGNDTSAYRAYLRQTPQQQATYPEEEQIFFNFETENLDSALCQSPLCESLVLYRGISPAVAQSVLNNSTYNESAFASTAYDITVSYVTFVNNSRSPDGYANILVLQRCAGEPALYINEEEREMLLPRNTVWDVVKTANVSELTVCADFPLCSSPNATVSPDFPLCNSTGCQVTLDNVRLIYVRERAQDCQEDVCQ